MVYPVLIVTHIKVSPGCLLWMSARDAEMGSDSVNLNGTGWDSWNSPSHERFATSRKFQNSSLRKLLEN